MALFDFPMLPKNGTLLLEDATGTPIALTVQYEDGDFAIDEMQAGYMETEILQDRGVDWTIVETKEQRLTATFTAYATDLADATEKTIPDACMKTGAFAAGVSVFGAARPWGIKCTYTQEQTNYGAGADSTIVLAKVRPLWAFAEAGTGKFTIKMMIFNPSSTVTRT
jgi:hypothetical protein